MIEGLFDQTGYAAPKKLLDLTALRHEALTSNLANLETQLMSGTLLKLCLAITGRGP